MREIAWERFFKLVPRDPQDSSAIDTRLAPRCSSCPFGEPVLARRTLLRGIKLKLPSGQDLADAARRRPPSTRSDLLLDKVPTSPRGRRSPAHAALVLDPLRGAEGERHRTSGRSGALIVGEVLLGLIETDPTSFLIEEPGWEPGEPRRDEGRLLDGLARALRAGREPD